MAPVVVCTGVEVFVGNSCSCWMQLLDACRRRQHQRDTPTVQSTALANACTLSQKLSVWLLSLMALLTSDHTCCVMLLKSSCSTGVGGSISGGGQ